MRSLCRLSVAKNYNFGQIWSFWGLLYRPPSTDECQIWCAIADAQCTFTCQHSSRSVYSLTLWRRKNPIFAFFWNSAFSDVDNIQQSEKVEHGCTTTNFPLSNGIKTISVLQCLHGEIGRTNSDVQERNGQKKHDDQKKHDGQTKNSTFFSTPAADDIQAPPNLAW